MTVSSTSPTLLSNSPTLSSKPLIFSGQAYAQSQEPLLKAQVETLREQGKIVHIAAVLFSEDEGSVLYSRLKQELAQRLGIIYSLHPVAITDTIDQIQTILTKLNADPSITGIIVQKPRRKIWEQEQRIAVETDPKASKQAFNLWWSLVMTGVDPKKDVDGLHPETIAAIQDGTWKEKGCVLPATVQATLTVLNQGLEKTNRILAEQTVAIIGRSDLLGIPLHAVLQSQVAKASLIGQAELTRLRQQGKFLTDYSVVISATGVPELLTELDVAPESILIDVGEPKADFADSAIQTALFASPVPGGVGPLTVISLMANALTILSNCR